jgi:small subunit ribosomal protein S5
MVGGTISHEAHGHFGAGSILLKPASAGTGVIAGPVVRAVLEALGVKNALTKSMRSSNPHNVVRATFDALEQLESAEQFAARLGKLPEDVYPHYHVRPSAHA